MELAALSSSKDCSFRPLPSATVKSLVSWKKVRKKNQCYSLYNFLLMKEPWLSSTHTTHTHTHTHTHTCSTVMYSSSVTKGRTVPNSFSMVCWRRGTGRRGRVSCCMDSSRLMAVAETTFGATLLMELVTAMPLPGRNCSGNSGVDDNYRMAQHCLVQQACFKPCFEYCIETCRSSVTPKIVALQHKMSSPATIEQLKVGNTQGQTGLTPMSMTHKVVTTHMFTIIMSNERESQVYTVWAMKQSQVYRWTVMQWFSHGLLWKGVTAPCA